MATIREKKKHGKLVSYSFTAYLGRDANGKQIRQYSTWKPPDGLPPSKSKKLAERAADAWEIEIRTKHESRKLSPSKYQDCSLSVFVAEVWLPYNIKGRNCKPTTIAYYQNISNNIIDAMGAMRLQEITPIKVQDFLTRLSKGGKSQKTIKHHYGVLTNIFNYAVKLDIITKSPMQKIDPPRKEKKTIDALSPEQAIRFFEAIEGVDLEFRCILYLLPRVFVAVSALELSGKI